MLTQESITALLLQGQVVQANKAKDCVSQERSGLTCIDWSGLTCISKLIEALSYQISIGDYSSEITRGIAGGLQGSVGNQYGGTTTNPNAQLPGGTTIIDNTQPSLNYNESSIPFENVTQIQWNNYQQLYAALYGNKAAIEVWIDNGDGTFSQDTGNVPQKTYENSNPNGNLVSVVINFPVPTSGYIQISGVGVTSY